MPIFAFLNAGVNLSGVSFSTITEPLPLGIALGLFLGKQLGAFGGAWIAVKLKFASLPKSVTWSSLYGVCVLSGIGFTMSLFIGTLAFSTIDKLSLVRIGVIIGSILSALMGIVILHWSLEPEDEESTP